VVVAAPAGSHCSPAASAAALVCLGRLTRERGDFRLAQVYGEQGLALAREIGDAQGLFDALTTLGWTVAFQTDWNTAEVLFKEARQCAERAGPWGPCIWDHVAGAAASSATRRRPSAPTPGRERGQAPSDRDRESVARCLCVLADIALRQARLGEADRFAREALEISQKLGYAWAWSARALDILVRLAAAQHQPDRAVRLAAVVSTMHPDLGKLLTRMARPDVVELARQEIGAAKAAAVWAEGEAMTSEEAVAFALNEAR
jgi:hypothetical protein